MKFCVLVCFLSGLLSVVGGEMYTSLLNIKQAISVERKLIDYLRIYIDHWRTSNGHRRKGSCGGGRMMGSGAECKPGWEVMGQRKDKKMGGSSLSAEDEAGVDSALKKEFLAC